MGELHLQPGEKFLAAGKAQLAEGFPQTAGVFRRLVSHSSLFVLQYDCHCWFSYP